MKSILSLIVLSATLSSAHATSYAAPAAVACKGAQYNLSVVTLGLEPGQMAEEYEETTEVLLIEKNLDTEERVQSFDTTGAGYNEKNKTYYYYENDSDRLVMTVKPRFFDRKAKVVLYPGNGKKLTYRNCKLYMKMPADFDSFEGSQD